MRILIVSHARKGGAYIAGDRFSKQMRDRGHEVEHLILLEKFSRRAALLRIVNRCWSYMVVRKGAFFTLPPIINSNRALVKYAESFQIVLLNWIGPGIINVQKLGYRQGWYYVMHDLRSITNGCHYINSCEKFNTNCENCPRVRFKAPPVSSSLDLIAISNWTFDHALKKT